MLVHAVRRVREEDLDAESLNSRLRDVGCVPTNQGRLYPPSWMFFENRPGLVDKFPCLLDPNCITRTERACVAMGAAGVRPVSEVVRGYVAGYVNPREDDGISERVSGRASLLRTILEGAAATVQEEDYASHLDSMRFIRVDELTMRWRLRAFNREWPDSPPEPAFAHWTTKNVSLFCQP